MNIADVMNGAIPGDLTLDQVTAYMMTVPELRAIVALSRYSDRVAIRYVLRDGVDEWDAPGTMSLTDFRARVAAGGGAIVISDRDGGSPVPVTPRPLVDA